MALSKKNPAGMFRDVAGKFLSGNTEDMVDIVRFVEQPWGLNFKLKPVQAFILKCYYDIPLEKKVKTISVPDIVNSRVLFEFTEEEFLKWLFDEGRCNTDFVEGKSFRELVFVAGRRSGKTTLSACISCYEIYKLIKRGNPAGFYGFPADQDINVTNVAPTDEQAGVLFSMITNLALNCPFMRDRVLNQTQTYFNLQTDNNLDNNHSTRKKRASIISRAGGCASNSVRGHNNIVVIMDEFAFFINNGGRFSGEEVYRAITPSTLSFRRDGKTVCISSPYAKYGAFWDRYNNSFNEPEDTLMFKMYTAMVNPDVDSGVLKAERRKDRVGFTCEYGGDFSEKITAWIDDEDLFRENIDLGISTKRKGEAYIDYFMGIDLGLKNDGSAIAIVHREEKTGRVILDYADVQYSGSSDVWDFDNSIYKNCRRWASQDLLKVEQIADEIVELCNWYPIRSGWCDQWNGYSLMEQLTKKGLKQFHMETVSETKASEMYQLVQSLYRDKLLGLFNHPVLVSEMLSLEAEKRNRLGSSEGILDERIRGKVIVAAPNKRGAHDDLSDAFVRAAFEAYTKGKDKTGHLTILVGGGSGTISSKDAKNISMTGFRRHKTKIHGDYPRMARMPKRRV